MDGGVMPPKPSCECGECGKCRRRILNNESRRRRQAAMSPEEKEAARLSYQARDRRRYYRNREARLAAVAARHKALGRSPKRADPVKVAARWAVGNAIKAGRLIRQSCQVCGDVAQAHHEDYAKPLEVEWLCSRHHGERHRQYPEEGAA